MLYKVLRYFSSKLFSLFIICILAQPWSFGQSLDWFVSLGSPARDAPFDIQVDLNGDVILTSFYEGSPASIAGMPLNHRDASDFLLSKFSADGDLIWVVDFSGFGFDRGNKIAVGPNNNLYLGGLFTDSLFISSAPDQPIVASGANDALLAKFDAGGNLLWNHHFGGAGSDIIYGLIANEEEIIVVGHFTDTLRAGLDGDSVVSRGRIDAFLASFATDGAYQWIKSFGGTGIDRAYDVIRDPQGNIVFNGYFSDTAYFDSLSIISSNGTSAFVCKTDPFGEVLWVHGLSSTGANDQSGELTVDPKGNIYLAGYFRDTIDLLNNLLYESSSGNQAYILALNPDGDFLWAKSTDGNIDNFFWDLDYSDDQLLAVGTAGQNLIWNDTSINTGADARGMITTLDLQANVQQTHLLGGAASAGIRLFEAAWGSENQIFICGMVDQGGIVDNQVIPSFGDRDVLLARFTLSETTSAEAVNSLPLVELNYDPSSSNMHMSTSLPSKINYRIVSVQGQMIDQAELVRQATYSFRHLPTGIYFLSLRHALGIETHKIVHTQ